MTALCCPPPKSWILTPLEEALAVLGGRAARVGQGSLTGWTLDGRPSDARLVVRAANTVLVRAGKPQIPYPGGLVK